MQPPSYRKAGGVVTEALHPRVTFVQDELPPKYTAGDYYAALYVKTSIKGFLIRAKVRPSGGLVPPRPAPRPPSPHQVLLFGGRSFVLPSHGCSPISDQPFLSL